MPSTAGGTHNAFLLHFQDICFRVFTVGFLASVFVSFFNHFSAKWWKWSKNEMKMKPKMAWKWLLWTTLLFGYLIMEYPSNIVTHATIIFGYYIITYSDDIRQIYNQKCLTFISIFVKYVTIKYFTFLLQYLLYICWISVHKI